MPFINKPDFLRDLPIFILSLIFSFEIFNAIRPDPKTFLWIAASVTNAAAVNQWC